MSIEVSAAEFEFAVARSDFVDGFNIADLAVRARLIALKVKPQQLLGPNLETLLKIPAGPQYPRAEKTNVDSAVEELRGLKQVRCDLVHGVMQHLVIWGVPHCLFQNVQEQPAVGRHGLLLNIDEMKSATEMLGRLAEALRPANHHT